MRCIILLLFLLPFMVKSQTVKGNFTDVNNMNIENATLLFSNLNSSGVVKEFAIVKKGFFLVDLKKNYSTLVVKINAVGFKSDSIIIQNPLKSQQYICNFKLKNDNFTKLEEVVITAKKRPFEIKKDTISYNVDSYSDGSERKIGEIIKKIPGIDVNEKSGEIKYKGRSIETVTLDGDNLFDTNYAIATKNISVDMVKQIEAIENYSKNPLLKGIERGGKVSLNLKLKEGEFDFSGDLETSTGVFDNGNFAGGFGANILGIKKSFKTFANIIQNNVGVNNSPFDYQSSNLNIEQIKEQQFYAEKIIPEIGFSNLLDDSRSNINNQIFINYNSIFKINKKLNLRLNLYQLNDKILSDKLIENNYSINTQSDFVTSDKTNNVKKPTLYRGDIEMKYNTSNSSLLEYNFRIKYEKINTISNLIQNQSSSFTSNLDSDDVNIINDLLWTKKISDSKVLQLSAFFSYSDMPQNFETKTVTNSYNNTLLVQKSNFKKKYLNTQATFFGKKGKNKYTFIIGFNSNIIPFQSNLYSTSNNISSITSSNDIQYNKNSLFHSGLYSFNFKKWNFTPSYNISLLNQRIMQDVEIKSLNVILQPSLKIRYRLNSKSFINGLIYYSREPNNERYLFQNEVLIDNRTSIKNIQNLSLKKNTFLSVSYYLNDLYKQFQLSAKISFKNNEGNYFSNADINLNTVQIQYFFLPQSNKDLNLSFQVSKFVTFLNSNLRINTSLSRSEFNNIVNNSSLRKNSSIFNTNQFIWNTAFDFPINLESNTSLMYSKSESENQSSFTTTSIHNYSKLKFKLSNKLFFSFTSNFYKPHLKDADKFFFLDALLRYRPKNRKWEMSLIMRNIGNELNFEQTRTTDISTTTFRSNLLERHILLNVEWNL